MEDIKDEKILKFYLEMGFKIVKEYNWLLDSYVLDFFTENHMDKLPDSWKKSLQIIPLNEFEFLMNPSLTKPNNLWPLSILSIKILVQHLSFSRKMIEDININFCNSGVHENSTKPLKIDFVGYKHPDIHKLFIKHVKPKKRHEILKMAEITANIANQLDINYVVDVGSGMGHLSRIMGYGFSLNVCSIETQSQLISQAKKLDCELENSAKKYCSEIELEFLKSKRPVHLNETIEFNVTPNEFLKSIKSAFCINDGNFNFGIVGLHPCGNLATVLLKIYTECPEAKFINLVGCCYHKLAASRNKEKNSGFPLTYFCTEKNINISYEARSLACHAIETYCSRLNSKNYEHLKVHCYRAALENIINKNWPQYRKNALGNVKSGPDLDFNKYCQTALKKLNISVSKEDTESDETEQILSRWKDVVKFYSLRLMIAPLVETIILLDRKLYLLEKGIQSKIVAAFDPEISPRNQLLISEKFKEDEVSQSLSF